MRGFGLGTPERQFIAVIIGIIEEPAFFGDQAACIGAGAPGVPPQRAFAGDAFDNLNRLVKMVAFDVFGQILVINPAIAVRANLMPVLHCGFANLGIARQRHGNGKDGDRDLAFTKQV